MTIPKETLYSTFAQKARLFPERQCLIDISKKLTYSETLLAIDTIAANLLSEGVHAGHSIAIYSQKSIVAVLYFIALSKLGCHVITLDLAFPEEQCRFVLADANVDFIICEKQFPHHMEIPVFSSDRLLLPNAGHDEDISRKQSNWIVYSSGTTGKPKGIRIPEQSMLNSFLKRETFSCYSKIDVVACSIYFYWEVFRPIIHGASVLILENQTILDFETYTHLLEQNEVTETLWTPSYAELFTKTATNRQLHRLSCLQRVWLNGEVVSSHLYHILKQRLPKVRFFNLYSISETFDVSAFELVSDESLSEDTATIGKPLPNTEILLLKPDYSQCQTGEKGELYIGGNSLAGGYLNEPEKEAASFIKFPQYPNSEYWFKTKDVAYQGDGGSFHIIGRNDDIVKLRGYNISLLSIENVIKRTVSLRQCYVRLEPVGDGEEQQIIAYLQPDDIEQFINDYDYEVDSGYSPVLYQQLSSALPHYAIPYAFKVVDNIHVNAYSAKLIRNSQPQHETDPIKALWQKCLNIPSTSITDTSDFFALGGTSLHAVQLVQWLNERFDKPINIQSLYQHPRFRAFKQAIEGHVSIKQVDPVIFEDMTWLPSSPQAAIHPHNFSTAQTIFMSGITGFLGLHWFHHLLKHTEAHIYCLIRCNSQEEGISRVEKAFATYQLQYPQWQQRVTILCGDLKLRHFGLSQDQWKVLTKNVDIIVHAAAHVNLMHGYGNLRDSTISGTQTALELAISSHIKPFYLISSDAVYNESNLGERETFLHIDSINDLTYGYAQTKWVQERLVKQMNEQFQLPYIIARLGNVAPSLQTKKSNPSDANGMVLEAVKGLKRQPNSLLLEFCPVDRLVSVLTELGKSSFENRIVSLNGINTVSSQELKQLMPDWGVENVDYHEWQQAVANRFPELFGLSSIPHLFTRRYEHVHHQIIQAPYTHFLQLNQAELRDSLLTMVEQ